MYLDQLEILSYVTIMHQPIASKLLAQTHVVKHMYVQIQHSLAHLQNLIPILLGITPAKVKIKSRKYFTCICVTSYKCLS